MIKEGILEYQEGRKNKRPFCFAAHLEGKGQGKAKQSLRVLKKEHSLNLKDTMK